MKSVWHPLHTTGTQKEIHKIVMPSLTIEHGDCRLLELEENFCEFYNIMMQETLKQTVLASTDFNTKGDFFNKTSIDRSLSWMEKDLQA